MIEKRPGHSQTTASMDGVTLRMLSERLNELIEVGRVQRTVSGEPPSLVHRVFTRSPLARTPHSCLTHCVLSDTTRGRDLAPEIDVWSAGTEPTGAVPPAVVEAMGEVGIDLTTAFPKPLTDEVVGAADVVVTMGCGEACPVVPGRRYEDWILAHPLGSRVGSVRSARDEIHERVEVLIGSLRAVAR